MDAEDRWHIEASKSSAERKATANRIPREAPERASVLKTYRMVYERYIKGNAVYSDVDGNMNRIYVPLDEFAPMPPPQRLWVTFTDLNPSQKGTRR